MTEIKQPKSWRDQIKVHPAADLFPMMSADELKALGEDIKENGLQARIAVWQADSGRPWFLVDGRNRLDAAELVGLSVKFINKGSGDVTVKIGDYPNLVDDLTSMDPYEYVISANIHRHHLTTEQKRDLIAAVLKAQPEKSNRTIAKQTKTDHKTVGAVRDKLEAGGEIPHHDVREDARGTKQPACKKPVERKPASFVVIGDDMPVSPRRAKALERETAKLTALAVRDQVNTFIRELTKFEDDFGERLLAWLDTGPRLTDDAQHALVLFLSSFSMRMQMLAQKIDGR